MQKPIPPLAPGALPVLGHVLEYRNHRNDLLRKGYAACGPVFSLKLMSQNVAVLAGPEFSKSFLPKLTKR